MDKYDKVSYELCEQLTKAYSTSFSMSSRLFDNSIRHHIYAIYAFARIGDEIVDTYREKDAEIQLINLETQTIEALTSSYSTNPILHAFAKTANSHLIDTSLISPFFESMRTDLATKTFTKKEYSDYIFGSAEVIGLMCLRVFTNRDTELYNELKEGASALGSAYQKINFLRDIKADNDELGRFYFPGTSYEKFTDDEKSKIIEDINNEFLKANLAIHKLPSNSKKAVRLSYLYYSKLLDQLSTSTVDELKNERIRVNDNIKVLLYIKVLGGL